MRLAASGPMPSNPPAINDDQSKSRLKSGQGGGDGGAILECGDRSPSRIAGSSSSKARSCPRTPKIDDRGDALGQPSSAAGSRTVSVRVPLGLCPRGGETPPQPAGEDACATGGSVKLRPFKSATISMRLPWIPQWPGLTSGAPGLSLQGIGEPTGVIVTQTAERVDAGAPPTRKPDPGNAGVGNHRPVADFPPR